MPVSGIRKRTVPAAALAILLVGGAVLAWTITQGSDASPACGADTLLTAQMAPGDVRLAPFAPDSPWKLPVTDTDPDEAATTSLETTALRAGTDGSGEVGSWINAEEYSLPVVQADTCDPIVTFETASPGDGLADTVVRIPAEAEAAAGTDRHLMVIQPDHRTVVELWAAETITENRWKVGRVEVVDLTGSGIGPDNGVRAYGGSALGGLIRRWEVDPGDANYTDGVIRHPLAIALPNSMLRYDGGDPGYDAAGYGMARGYIPPATEQDYDSPWMYQGPIPMGSKVMLDRSVDIDSLNLPSALVPVARALQDYGAYVTDRSGDGTVVLYAEPTVPSDWLDSARGPSSTGADLDRIRSLLVVVP